MKTTLSVKDFVIIEKLLDDAMRRMENMAVRIISDESRVSDGALLRYTPPVDDARVQDKLAHNREYQDLKHLSQALGELQVEVQTPDVEITE